MTTRRPLIHLRALLIFGLLLWCAAPVKAQRFLPDSLNQKLIDSLLVELDQFSLAQLDSLQFALMDVFTADELRMIDRWQDSLMKSGDHKRMIIPPDRIKNEDFSTTIREMPGYSVYLPLPDNWKDIDPFAHQSMMPKLPKRRQAPLPDYARFSVGMVGYYFAFQNMGYTGFYYPDTIQVKPTIDLSMYDEEQKTSPKLVKTLNQSKTILVILAIILQALL